MTERLDPLIASLVADLQPTPPLRQSRGMAMMLAALALGMGAAVVTFGARADLAAGHPSGMFLLSNGLFLVLALASAWTVVDSARPYVGVHREGWGWTALMAAVLPLSALCLLGSEWLVGAGLSIDDGSWCLGLGLGLSGLTALALVRWLRRGAPSSPKRAGLLAGVAAGSAGVLAVGLACPHNDMVHIGIWHGMTVVLAGVLGRLFVPRLIAW
ncbi:MAG: DUF1109 domain-containing protein [Novosphingobium sp.]|uniref:DUF1109 domain-containing protein n=1 Tax=Novosphingobium sp. TaxID=1874826 RepID=UPI0032B81345